MLYLIWALPALAVIGAIASGLAGTLPASLIGLATALAVALATAPQLFGIADAGTALLRGAWIGWIVVPYILGGLLFWQMAIRPGDAADAGRDVAAGCACAAPPAVHRLLSDRALRGIRHGLRHRHHGDDGADPPPRPEADRASSPSR